MLELVNTIAPHTVDPVKLQRWRADVERAHGTLEEYARETKSGLSAQEVEKLAGRHVQRSTIPDKLEKIVGYFEQDTDLEVRLKKFAASHHELLRYEESFIHSPPHAVSDDFDQRMKVIAVEALLAEKFARAWDLMSSGDHAMQNVGVRFLDDLKENAVARVRIERALNGMEHSFKPQERKEVRAQGDRLRRSLFTDHGTLHESIARSIRTVHECGFDNPNPRLRAAYDNAVKDLHRRMDDICYLGQKIRTLTMSAGYHQACGDALNRLNEAYGVHVYDMIAKEVGYARYVQGTLSPPQSTEANGILYEAIEGKKSRCYLDFLREPSLIHWKAHMDATDRMVASAFLRGSTQGLASNAFILDSTTKTFEYQMQRIHEAQLRRSASNTAGPIIDVDRLMRDLDLGDEPGGNTGKQKIAAKKSRKHIAPAGATTSSAPIQEETDVFPAQIRRAIGDSLHDRRESRRLEGEAAETIAENYSIFASIIGMNEKFARRDRSELGEIDVHLDNAIVECTLLPGGAAKERQIEKLLTNKLINPSAKRVILYAPNYTKAAEKRLIVKHGADLLVARTPDDLGLMLFVNWSDRTRAQAHRSHSGAA